MNRREALRTILAGGAAGLAVASVLVALPGETVTAATIDDHCDPARRAETETEVRRLYEQAPPDVREAMFILVVGMTSGLDPSSELVRILGEEDAAGFIQCWQDTQTSFAAVSTRMRSSIWSR